MLSQGLAECLRSAHSIPALKDECSRKGKAILPDEQASVCTLMH
jgi:hypothetical protein